MQQKCEAAFRPREDVVSVYKEGVASAEVRLAPDGDQRTSARPSVWD